MGCFFAPVGTIWIWAARSGMSQGALFAIAMTVIVLRSPDAQVAAHLSSMAQGGRLHPRQHRTPVRWPVTRVDRRMERGRAVLSAARARGWIAGWLAGRALHVRAPAIEAA